VALHQGTIAGEVARYLRTGDTDVLYHAWPGGVLERAERAKVDLRGALVREVLLRAEGRGHAPIPQGDGIALVRGKVAPMVRGLFPRAEQDVVLATLERSVVFMTAETIQALLLHHAWDHSAWTLANLYLAGVGAELLAGDAPRIVGMSVEATCYVSPSYFVEESPFADFVVHEAAHIFHNCKRGAIGLGRTRTKEWLLDVDFVERETFAYACEAYACVLARANRPAERRALAAEFARDPRLSDDSVDVPKVVGIVGEAAAARHGWKVILRRCAPTGGPRPVASHPVGPEAAGGAEPRRMCPP